MLSTSYWDGCDSGTYCQRIQGCRELYQDWSCGMVLQWFEWDGNQIRVEFSKHIRIAVKPIDTGQYYQRSLYIHFSFNDWYIINLSRDSIKSYKFRRALTTPPHKTQKVREKTEAEGREKRIVVTLIRWPDVIEELHWLFYSSLSDTWDIRSGTRSAHDKSNSRYVEL